MFGNSSFFRTPWLLAGALSLMSLWSLQADDGPDGLSSLVDLLAQLDDADVQLDLLKGMHQALEGRRSVKMPAGWRAAYSKLAKSESAAVRDKALELALIFGDQAAIATLRKTALDQRAPPDARQRAIHALVQGKIEGLAPLLQKLLADREVRGEALRGLGAYADAKTPDLILGHYAALTAEERQDAIQTLAARPAYAARLLDGIEQQVIPARDVSAFTARQIQALGDEQISVRLTKLWGNVGTTSKEQKQLVEKYKRMMTADLLKEADLRRGQALFKKNCMSCHKLYGEGGDIGPDITGSNRDNLDYVLGNVLTPSVTVARDYRVTNIRTIDGRLLSGIIVAETAKTLTMQTVNQRVVIDKNDIDEQRQSQLSMMPDGLADKLTDEEFRDLIAYLARKTPLPDSSNK